MAEPVTEIIAPRNGATPEEVTLYQEDLAAPRFTPRELNTVREYTGKSFGQILVDEESDDKFTVLAWLKLRRSGFTVDWDAMADVVIAIKADVSGVDPTSGARPTTSPPSAVTGE